MKKQRGHALLVWFDEHKRDLPWRRTRDPYAIWISEVMLQQTRVAAVLDHYTRWLARFPTIAALAQAEESDVLAIWSGLGYYRRARMLHHAAKIIAADHAGQLPRTAAELTRLPGIGAYTSAAVASIAFNQPIAVVDGNVERVLTRLEALSPQPPSKTAQSIRQTASAILDPSRPGDSNQALMELGATICLPRAPLCLSCPLEPWCQTRGEHPTVPRKPLTPRAIAYALAERPSQILLRQRPAQSSLMPNLWEFPELNPGHAPQAQPLLRLKHSITVTSYSVTIFATPVEPTAADHWHSINQLPNLPLTGLARKVLRRLNRWPGAHSSDPNPDPTPLSTAPHNPA